MCEPPDSDPISKKNRVSDKKNPLDRTPLKLIQSTSTDSVMPTKSSTKSSTTASKPLLSCKKMPDTSKISTSHGHSGAKHIRSAAVLKSADKPALIRQGVNSRGNEYRVYDDGSFGYKNPKVCGGTSGVSSESKNNQTGGNCGQPYNTTYWKPGSKAQIQGQEGRDHFRDSHAGYRWSRDPGTGEKKVTEFGAPKQCQAKSNSSSCGTSAEGGALDAGDSGDDQRESGEDQDHNVDFYEEDDGDDSGPDYDEQPASPHDHAEEEGHEEIACTGFAVVEEDHDVDDSNAGEGADYDDGVDAGDDDGADDAMNYDDGADDAADYSGGFDEGGYDDDAGGCDDGGCDDVGFDDGGCDDGGFDDGGYDDDGGCDDWD